MLILSYRSEMLKYTTHILVTSEVQLVPTLYFHAHARFDFRKHLSPSPSPLGYVRGQIHLKSLFLLSHIVCPFLKVVQFFWLKLKYLCVIF